MGGPQSTLSLIQPGLACCQRAEFNPRMPVSHPSRKPSLVFVLVGSRSPGNLGAVCRAAKAFGITDVRLVRPRADPRDAESVRLAHGAEDVLAGCPILPDLEAALKDCARAIATTARSRDWSRRVLSCEELSTEFFEARVDGPIAVVFGPEDRGLTNDELARCDAIVSIAIDESSGATLSLPASAAIVAHSLTRAVASKSRPPARGMRSERGARVLSSSQIDQLLEDIRAALGEIGFRPKPNEIRFRGSLRDFLARARPTEGDRLFLRHMLAQLQKWRRRVESELSGRAISRGDPS